MLTRCSWFVICWICIISTSVLGQETGNTFINPDPTARDSIDQSPMENVFFNTVWGSLVGGTLTVSGAFLNDSKPSNERFSFSESADNFVRGATYGGFVGLLIGFYLALNDVEFYERDLISRLTFAPARIPDQSSIRLVMTERSSPRFLHAQDSVIALSFTF